MDKKLMNKYYKLRNTIDQSVCRWTPNACNSCKMNQLCSEFRKQFAIMMHSQGKIDCQLREDFSMALRYCIYDYCLGQDECEDCIGRKACEEVFDLIVSLKRGG